jgi:hypothetical protein
MLRKLFYSRLYQQYRMFPERHDGREGNNRGISAPQLASILPSIGRSSHSFHQQPITHDNWRSTTFSWLTIRSLWLFLSIQRLIWIFRIHSQKTSKFPFVADEAGSDFQFNFVFQLRRNWCIQFIHFKDSVCCPEIDTFLSILEHLANLTNQPHEIDDLEAHCTLASKRKTVW